MEQFSNFTYIKQIDLDTIGSKFNMSYRLKCLLEEQIDLSKYGDAIQHISFSPLIGEVFPPESKYNPSKKKLKVEYLMNPEQAIEVNEPQFFQLMLEGLMQAMEEMNLPGGFDFETFKKDVLGLRYEQLKQAA
jgi:hypothetical protein